MEPIKLGVIGVGVIGSTNLKDAMASDLIDVVAVADLRAERRQFAQEQGVARVYQDGRELLDEDDEVEAVIIAFPAMGRTAMALRAFARGKHVLTEKPVAMNAREVETMIEARGDLVAACFSARYRFHEPARVATELVASGALGQLHRLHVRALHAAGPRTDRVPPPWRESFTMNAGGILTNWSCYDLDYILGIAGWRFRPKTVLANWWPCVPQFSHHVAPESDADAHFVAMVTGEDGCVLTVERCEFMPLADEDAWQIIGSDGSLRLQMTATRGGRIVHDDSAGDDGVASHVIWEGDSAPGGGSLLIEDFAQAIREGREPATNLDRSLVLARIMDAIYASAASGGAVDIC